MIVVIADDLTGAAEISGFGLRYTKSIRIVTGEITGDAVDMLVVSTDTRSMHKAAAIAKTAQITTEIAKLKPELIFKKVDSALRGYVVEEIAEHLKILRLKKALLVPANPSLGRKIIDGMYYLNDQPIHLTGFSKDPEFPIVTSVVSSMVAHGIAPVYIMNHQQPLPESGIVVGEAASDEDLMAWAGNRGKDVFVAGGSGFFNAIVNSMHFSATEATAIQPENFKQPALFVCGSAYAKSIELVKAVKDKGGPVTYISGEMLASADGYKRTYDRFRDDVIASLKQFGKAIIAIDPQSVANTNTDAKTLRDRTAAAVHSLFQEIMINELIVEGGSTANAIIKKLGLQTLYPVQEISAGLVRMGVHAKGVMHLTIKPGSYAWSKKVWTF